jgi:hypothetical protein
MDTESIGKWIEDFKRYSKTVDIKAVIAAADEQGNAPGWEKQIYSIAIVRALHQGELGNDYRRVQEAVATLWERGHVLGFSTDSFNGALRKLGAWPHQHNHAGARRPGYYDRAVGQ